MAPPKTVFLACPYGQAGGGMGSMMTYLAGFDGARESGFRLKRLETRGAGHAVFSVFYLARALALLAAEAFAGRLAIVHVNVAERGSTARKGILLLFAKALGARVLLHLHAAEFLAFYNGLPRAGRSLLGWIFQSADHCVVLGETWRRFVIEAFGLAPESVSVVRNGVPAPVVPRVPRPPRSPFRLLFLGNLQERKGISDLLEALARPEALAVDLMLTATGGGPVQEYTEKAARLGIGERVRFTGWVNQETAHRHIANADALVLPSYDEGLPVVILEALASRVPVICTPVGAIPEVLTHGVTAMFVSPGDQAALAETIVTLSGDAALQERLSAAGFMLYKQHSTMDSFARQIMALYARLTRMPAGSRPGQAGHQTA